MGKGEEEEEEEAAGRGRFMTPRVWKPGMARGCHQQAANVGAVEGPRRDLSARAAAVLLSPSLTLPGTGLGGGTTWGPAGTSVPAAHTGQGAGQGGGLGQTRAPAAAKALTSHWVPRKAPPRDARAQVASWG